MTKIYGFAELVQIKNSAATFTGTFAANFDIGMAVVYVP